MSIILHVEPKTVPLTKEEFIKVAPVNSIALDGYVKGSPWFELSGPYANFNHHEDVCRLATRATCGQVLMAVRQGLFSTFLPVGKNKLHIFVNDCDEDVCLSVFLIKHGILAKNVSNPILNKLVFIEDAQDTTCGAYPFPPDEKITWVFEPYRQFRLLGGLDRKDPLEYESIITDVENRIMQYVLGNAGSVEINTSFETIGGGPGWLLIKEIGTLAKTGVFLEGHKAYVSIRQRPNGNYTYSIGKMAFWNLDLLKLFDKLNELENTSPNSDKWGGGDNAGGSPRVNGSKLTPDIVQTCINAMLVKA